MADTTFQQFTYTLTAGQGEDYAISGSWIKAVAIEPVFDIEAGAPEGEFLLPKLSIEGSTKTDFRAGFTLFPDNPFTKIRLENPNTNQGMKITILIGTGDVRDDSVIFSRDSGAITVVQERVQKRLSLGSVHLGGRFSTAEGAGNRNGFSFPAQTLEVGGPAFAPTIYYDASFYGQAKVIGENPNRAKLKLTAKRANVLISTKKFELPYINFVSFGEYYELLQCLFEDWLARYSQDTNIIRPTGNIINADGTTGVYASNMGNNDVTYANQCDVISTGGLINGAPTVTIRNESGYSPAYSSIRQAHPGILLNNGTYVKAGEMLFLKEGESFETEANGEFFACAADNWASFVPDANGDGGSLLGYEETYYV